MEPGPARVIVSQRFFDDAAIQLLQDAGCEVVLAELPEGEADGNLSHDQLVAMLEGAAGWIVGHARVTRELLAALPDLRLVSRRGVGYARVAIAAEKAPAPGGWIAAGATGGG